METETVAPPAPGSAPEISADDIPTDPAAKRYFLELAEAHMSPASVVVLPAELERVFHVAVFNSGISMVDAALEFARAGLEWLLDLDVIRPVNTNGDWYYARGAKWGKINPDDVYSDLLN